MKVSTEDKFLKAPKSIQKKLITVRARKSHCNESLPNCSLEGTSGFVFPDPETTSSSPASENYFLGTTSSLCFYRAGAQGGSVTFWDCPLHPRRETAVPPERIRQPPTNCLVSLIILQKTYPLKNSK